jgi:hypothetical protein
MPDYFDDDNNDTRYPVRSGPNGLTKKTAAALPSTKGLPSEKQSLYDINGATLQLQSSGPASGVNSYNSRHTVYVDGNVHIRNNIEYPAAYPGNKPPNFTLVVRGNIYIHPSVTRLDGFYVAQPKSGQPNSGRIYTCATAPAALSGPAVYSQCGASTTPGNARQLRVNGAFAAQKVVLNRSGYSLRDSIPTTATNSETAANSKAAEVFSFSPEMYLSPPVFQPGSVSGGASFQSMSIMAPLL